MLTPFSSKEINFTIKPGISVNTTHCGVLFFETSIGKGFDSTGKAIDILGRVGSLIIIDPVSQRKNAEFYDITLTAGKIEGTFTNTGNTFLYVKGPYYIIDEAGIVHYRSETQELYLLPNDKAKINLDLPKDITPGKYTFYTFNTTLS